jgi:hypothetical protein
MIVTVHQPNLFPWLGFFDKMACSDVFIFLDNVQFTKRGFQNRVQVKGPQGAQWLTLPVKTKGRYYQLTCDVEINDEFEWQKEHLRTLQAIYRGTPGYEKIMPSIERLYSPSYQNLIDLTIPSIEWIKNELEIDCKLVRASDLGVTGSRSQLISDLVLAAGGTTYLSGPSGRDYLDEAMFAEKGINVTYHRFQMVAYPQRFGEFIGGLSTLDYLFNDPALAHWKQWSRK